MSQKNKLKAIQDKIKEEEKLNAVTLQEPVEVKEQPTLSPYLIGLRKALSKDGSKNFK